MRDVFSRNPDHKNPHRALIARELLRAGTQRSKGCEPCFTRDQTIKMLLAAWRLLIDDDYSGSLPGFIARTFS